jgi:hypothetical protein
LVRGFEEVAMKKLFFLLALLACTAAQAKDREVAADVLIHGAAVLQLPTASTTMVGNDTTDSLTHKTIDASANTLSNIPTSAISGSALSGTNTGDVTLGTANGLSLTGQVLSLQASDSSHTGALTSTDWSLFNGKQDALTFGSISTSTTGVSIANGSNSTVGPSVTVDVQTASGSQPGLLSSSDWSTFNGKQSALTFGSITTSTTGVSIGSGSSSTVGPNVTVNIQTASGSQPGLLSAADWSTFNGKQSTLTLGNLTDAGTDGITVTGGTSSVVGSGTSLSQHVADTTHNGYLSSTDWNTFNGKQSTLTLGNLTDVGTDGITVTGGTGSVVGSGTSVSQHVSDSTHNGYLSSTDWSTFNGKQAAGNYITTLTGDVTASGPGSSAATLATVNSNVGSFTNASITVNAKGLVTAASSGTASPTPTQEVPSGTVNGSNTSFTLAHTPSASSTLVLSADGMIYTQGAGKDYTISGATITFSVAPTLGQVLWAVYSY